MPEFCVVLVVWAQSTFVSHDQLRLTSQITLAVLTLRSLWRVGSVWGAACRRVTTSDALIVNDLTSQFGGIWLETGEQATSPTPRSSHQQQRHQRRGLHEPVRCCGALHQRLRNVPSES